MARVGATSAFAGEPQPVEVFHRGRWYAGDLLGWRHQEDGSCQARVRCVVDGLRHSAWVALSDLRLPRPVDQAPPPPAARRSARPAPPRPALDDDTQPHLLLPRLGGRPPVPRVPAAAARTPVAGAALPPVVPPAPAPVAAPAARTAPASRGVPTTRAIPVQDAVPIG
jgi:hypothetical protein